MTDHANVNTPIVAPRGASPAEASNPNQPLDGERYHTYESHPVPWWITLAWVSFFGFGLIYLLIHMIH